MFGKISIIDNKKLKQHERINRNHLKKLIKEIAKDGFIKNPIIVDKDTLIILDGHHRFNALKLLGMSSIPCYLC